jgi:ribulose-bisphosphate carboxylase large chain
MYEKRKTPLPCDWGKRSNKEKRIIIDTPKLYKYKGNFTWQGTKTERYKSSGMDWSDIVKQTLIGNHGETTKFHLRYFEIAPKGYSSFEIHKHEHVVIGIRGKGICIVGKKRFQISFLDTLYIQPNTPHQLRNPFDKPFGFFCIVNAKRDRPMSLAKSIN